MDVISSLTMSPTPRPPVNPGATCNIVVCCAPNSVYQALPAGSCPDTTCVPISAPVNCPMIYQPVCGSDGKTYGNNCEARRANVTIASDGACDNNDPQPRCMIPKLYLPVCGVNGKTYSNSYAARCENVAIDYDGPCKPNNPGPVSPPPLPEPEKPGIPTPPGTDRPVICTRQYAPVCDISTGTTYGNSCLAKAAGVTNFTQGKCVPVSPERPGTGSGPVKPGTPVNPEGPGNPGGPEKPPPGEPGARPENPGKPELPGGGNGNFNGGICGLE